MMVSLRKGNDASGEHAEARGHVVADGQAVVAMGHHAEAFRHIDQHDVVGHVRAGLGRGRAGDQRGGVDRARAARALRRGSGAPQAAQKRASKILHMAASCAGLKDDGLRRHRSSRPCGALIAPAPATC